MNAGHHIEGLFTPALELLKQLIATPSFSKEEDKTAAILEQFFRDRNMKHERHMNNVWCRNKFFDANKPTLLLNSHHDTVKPNQHYHRDPFHPVIEEGRLYGLGSNDAGGALVCLIAAFIYYYETHGLAYNLILAATAEEEISGVNGIESILALLPPLDAAIVGEPTEMNLAVAEKGLLVLDCTVYGKAGHAAREEGDNAIVRALKDINWFINYKFPKLSPTLGQVRMSVTVIYTENKAHNVVPAECRFVVDVRVTEAYTHEEIITIITNHVGCEVKPRSLRLRPSKIALDHLLVLAGLKSGKSTYGSPTTSDQALIPVDSLKCGPGDSARSHTADEYIYLEEIKEGIEMYINMIGEVVKV